MFKIIEIILSIVSLILGTYIIFSNNFKYIPFIQFSIASVLVIRGIRDLKENEKASGVINIAVGIIFIIIGLTVKF